MCILYEGCVAASDEGLLCLLAFSSIKLWTSLLYPGNIIQAVSESMHLVGFYSCKYFCKLILPIKLFTKLACDITVYSRAYYKLIQYIIYILLVWKEKRTKLWRNACISQQPHVFYTYEESCRGKWENWPKI